MSNGLKRFYGNGDLHFITASCYQRQPLLGSARRRDLFVKVLERVRQRYEFVVVGYVVMPEHFHLLISEPEQSNPSVIVKALKLGVVRRLYPTSGKAMQEWDALDLFDTSPPKISGNGASMTSTSGARVSIVRSFVIFIAIP